MAETDIELEVGLNTSNVVQRSRALRKEVARIFDHSDLDKADSKMQGILSTMTKLSSTARTTSERIRELSKEQVPTEAFSKATREVEVLSDKLERAKQEYKEYEQAGASKEFLVSIAQQKDGVADLQIQLEDAQAKMQSLVDSGKAFAPGTEVNSAEIEKLQSQLLNTNNQMTIAISKAFDYNDALRQLDQTEAQATNEGNAYKGILQSLQYGFGLLKESAVEGANGLKTFAMSLPQRIVSGAITGVRKLGNVLKQLGAGALKGAIKGMQRLGGAIKNGLNHKHVSKFGKTFSTVLKAAIGVRGLYALVRKLTAAVKEGINNVAQWNGGNNKVNESLSMLMSSLTQFKNAIGAAFSPIIPIVAPVLNTLIELLTKAATAVGQFFAKLGGSNTALRATKVNQNYAKSLDKTGASAKKASEALGDYDELKVIQSDSDSGSSGGGGLDPNSMFEEVPIDSSITELVNKIKESWKNADFTEIGLIVGNKFKGVLDTASDFIVTKAQPFATRLGTSIATFLNGFFSTPGLAASLGNTIAQTLNTALNFAYSFVTTFDFKQFGTFIGTALSTAITNFNWIKAARGLSSAIKGLLNSLTGFMRAMDWQQIGNDVADFIANIDWSGIADSLFTALGTALASLAEFLWGLIEDAWNSVVQWWKDTAYEDGKFTMQGLLDGIWNVIKDIGKWIYDHIFKPFVDGFKEAFEIHSPSKVMETLGGYLVEGLLNPIKKMPEKVVKFFQDMKDRVKEKCNDLTSDVRNKFNTMKDNANFSVQALKDNVQTKFQQVKSGIQPIMNGIFSDNSSIWDRIKNNAIWTMALMSNGIKGIFEGLWGAIRNPLNWVLGGIESFVNGVIRAMNSMIRAINGLQFTVPGWVPGLGGRHLGFSIPSLGTVSIPRLAQGGVIPPNNEFLAVLGDQKSGTNIEAPLDTIVEAFKQVTGENSNNNAPIVLQLNGREVARVVWDESEKRYKQTGNPSFA